MKNQNRANVGNIKRDKMKAWKAIYPKIPPFPVHAFGWTKTIESFPWVLLRFLTTSAKVQNKIVNPITNQIRSSHVFTGSISLRKINIIKQTRDIFRTLSVIFDGCSSITLYFSV